MLKPLLSGEMFLCILFTGLVYIREDIFFCVSWNEWPGEERGGGVSSEESPLAFAGFPTLAPMTFHLFASYSLIAASKAALFRDGEEEKSAKRNARAERV